LALRGSWAGLFEHKPAELLWSPSATAFVALGAIIGLMIGLAQVILKEAWLRVEAGFKAGRELIVARDILSIGRAEACDVGLFGAPTVDKVHAHILRQGNDYVVQDAGSASGTYVNDRRLDRAQVLRDGDLIRIGRSVLRFGERAKKTRG